MKCSILTSDLNYGLNMVTRAIDTRSVKPIYDGVYMECGQAGMTLICTNGEMTIRAEIPAVVEQEGVAVLPGKFLYDLCRYQTGDTVTLNVDENLKCRFRSASSSSVLMGMDPDDFPMISDVRTDNPFFLESGKYKDAVSRVMFAISTDEARKILTGVLTEIHPTETILVGLDGFRLALQRIPQENSGIKGEKFSFVVPGRCIGEIAKMLPDGEDDLEVRVADGKIMFLFGNIKVYSSLLIGEFIDYERILPTTWTTQIQLNKQNFDRALDRCSLMAREGKNNLIYFNIRNDGILELKSSAEKGEIRDEVGMEFEGNELEIAFNARYLLDVMKNLTTERIRLCFNTKVSPCMILPPEGKEFLYLVLPVRV